MKAIIQCFNQTYAVQTRRESSLRFFSLKTSNLSSLAAKSKKSILRKGLVARFSQDVQFELFGRQKVQKERLEKRFGGSIPGASWKRFSYPAALNHISPYIYSFSRTRQESSHQTFSQDALFGLFGGQKAQIGRLEKIKEQNCGFFAMGDWNRVRAIPGLTVHFLVSFAFNGFYCRKLVSNSLLAQKDFSMAGFDIKKTN